MKWTDIRKLEKGDVITYGNRTHTSKCRYIRTGRVLFVTVKGGIRVEILREDGSSTHVQQWVCYAHVVSFPRTQRKRAA